ncbi:MAG: hypothetical protein M1549_02975 [Candidatus Dependentiae bacterium]|nr:hypothetical protein [Candidatus Dependentiae bacterium]
MSGKRMLLFLFSCVFCTGLHLHAKKVSSKIAPPDALVVDALAHLSETMTALKPWGDNYESELRKLKDALGDARTEVEPYEDGKSGVQTQLSGALAFLEDFFKQLKDNKAALKASATASQMGGLRDALRLYRADALKKVKSLENFAKSKKAKSRVQLVQAMVTALRSGVLFMERITYRVRETKKAAA